MKKQFSIEKDLKMLFIGQTGAGKSTLINMIVNKLFEVDYEGQRKVAIPFTEKFVYQDSTNKTKTITNRVQCNIDEFKDLSTEAMDKKGAVKSESKSQTTFPMIYGIKDSLTNKQITIIDTPGLNDTEGSNVDEQHIHEIISTLFSAGGVHMVCLVHNATDARLMQSTMVALNRLMNIFTKSCLNNIVVCLTNSPKATPPNCLDALNELGIPLSNLFRFENSCIGQPGYLRQYCVKEPKKVREDVEDIIESNEKPWKSSMKEITNLLELGFTMECLDIESVKKLYTTREATDKRIQLLADKVRAIEEIKNNLEIQKKKVEEFKQAKTQNQDFKKSKIVREQKIVRKKVKKTRKVKRYSYEKQQSDAFGSQYRNNMTKEILGSIFGFFSHRAALYCLIAGTGVISAPVACALYLGGTFWTAKSGFMLLANTAVDSTKLLCTAGANKLRECAFYTMEDESYEESVDDVEFNDVYFDDEEKMKIFLEAQEKEDSAGQKLKQLTDELSELKNDKDLHLRVMGYLLRDLENSAAGSVITLGALISIRKDEIKYLKSLLEDERYEKDKQNILKDIEDLEQKKARLVIGGEIIEEARKLLKEMSPAEMGKTRASDMKVFGKILEEEIENEGKKLETMLILASTLDPCFIN